MNRRGLLWMLAMQWVCSIDPYPPEVPNVEIHTCRVQNALPLVALQVNWVPSMTDGEDIQAYEVQYANANDREWISIGDDLLGIPEHSNYLDVQTITTQADPGQTITAGAFRLSFSTRTTMALDLYETAQGALRVRLGRRLP